MLNSSTQLKCTPLLFFEFFENIVASIERFLRKSWGIKSWRIPNGESFGIIFSILIFYEDRSVNTTSSLGNWGIDLSLIPQHNQEGIKIKNSIFVLSRPKIHHISVGTPFPEKLRNEILTMTKIWVTLVFFWITHFLWKFISPLEPH